MGGWWSPGWALSPDGNKIAFIKGEDGIWVMNVSGGDMQRIVDPDIIDEIVWGPDSNQIFYRGSSSACYIVKITDGKQEVGTYLGMHDIAWSPDGSWFAYNSHRGLVKRPVSGGPEFVLDPSIDDPGEGQPTWSPDAMRVAYMKDGDIFVINADGSGQTRLTDSPALDRYPCWSPDASKIAFVTNRDGNNEIYVMNPDGSDQMNLTNSAEDEWRPTWAP